MPEWEEAKKQAKICIGLFALMTGLLGFSIWFLIVEPSTFFLALAIISFVSGVFFVILGKIKIDEYKKLLRENQQTKTDSEIDFERDN
jgi:hypothetical protein